jgi:hypothetical protein
MAATAGGDGGGGTQAAMQQTWTQAVERVKREVISPTLWRSIERVVPVAWENNTFVIGLSPGEGQLAGPLNTGEYRGAIERTLRTLTGSPELTLRVIEGTAYSDWEYTQKRDAAAVAQRQQATQKRYTEASAFASWDDLYDQVSRLWANFEYRSLASGRGRFLDQALGIVEKGMATLYAAGTPSSEQAERGLSRVIERVASMTNSDPALVAFLLAERRRRQQPGNGDGGA